MAIWQNWGFGQCHHLEIKVLQTCTAFFDRFSGERKFERIERKSKHTCFGPLMPLIQICLHGVDAVLGSVVGFPTGRDSATFRDSGTGKTVTFVPSTSRVKQFPPDTSMKPYFPAAGTVHSFADTYLFSILYLPLVGKIFLQS